MKKATGKISSYFHEKLPTSFHGTGDIFASVCVGALMRGWTLEKSYALAADYVVESIKDTTSHKDYNWYGVDFGNSRAVPCKTSGKIIIIYRDELPFPFQRRSFSSRHSFLDRAAQD